MSGERNQSEELRIALVMNGGVSLAVWMGGVTNEIFRLVRRNDPIYWLLGKMMRTTVRVDVISGTSAGGINGAALSLALLYKGNFSSLRDVWLKTGSLGDLLRSPLQENPGSLLRGEDFFLPAIEDAFSALCWTRPDEDSRTRMPLDLRLTTTLLTGKQGNSVDDLGVKVNDVDYRAFFHFRHNASADGKDFLDPTVIVPLLARAARSTASFPLAFEPSLVPAFEKGGQPLKDLGGENLETPRYVVDGGLLDNKPFRGALSAIFKMPRQGRVRRVLAYINPDPGDGVPGKIGGDMPPLTDVLAESVVGIPMSQSISDQLREIQAHNSKVLAGRESIASLVSNLHARATIPASQGGDAQGKDKLEMLAGELFGVYRQRRLSSTFESFVADRLPDAAREMAQAGQAAKLPGKQGRAELKRVFMDPQRTFGGWLPRGWPQPDDSAFSPGGWKWGLFPVEFGASLMLDLLRKFQQLPKYPDKEESRETGGTADAQALRPTTAERFLDAPLDSSDAGPLADLWRDAYAIVKDLTQKRSSEEDRWKKNTRDLLQVISADDYDKEKAGAGINAMFEFVGEKDRAVFCATKVYEIARVIDRACSENRWLLGQSAVSTSLRDEGNKDIAELKALVRLFLPSEADLLRIWRAANYQPIPQELDRAWPANTLEHRWTVRRILQLEVIEFAFRDHDNLTTDQTIELVQFSGNSASPLGGCSSARQKLLGLQLGHFGAFYKRSWRANDWTFGRLDGSERLVRILLNPERLSQIYLSNRQFAIDDVRHIAVDSVDDKVLKGELDKNWADEGYDDRLRKELAFLEDARLPLPDALPDCARAITTRLHFEILYDELPVLLASVRVDQSLGADRSGPGEAFLQKFRQAVESSHGACAFAPPARVREALCDGLVANETFWKDAGSDLFTRTLVGAAASLQGALASKGAGATSGVFAPFTRPVQIFYLLALGLLKHSRTGAALLGGLLAAGAVLFVLDKMFGAQDRSHAVIDGLLSYGKYLLALGLFFSLVRLPLTGAVLAAAVVLACLVLFPFTPLGVLLATAFLTLLSFRQWLLGLVIALTAYVAYATDPCLLIENGAPGNSYEMTLAYGAILAAFVIGAWQASPVAPFIEGRLRAAFNGLRLGRPWSPTNVKACLGEESVIVSFEPPGCIAKNRPILEYLVTSDPAGVRVYSWCSPVRVGGLEKGKPYAFRVRAVNAVGTGAASLYSNEVTLP